MVVLSTQAAYIFHGGLRCWACLADHSFPTSAYSSLLPSQGSTTGQHVLDPGADRMLHRQCGLLQPLCPGRSQQPVRAQSLQCLVAAA